mgnify:CR=1 FL=1|jgi:type IV pilus assembly protein PilQ
MKYFKHSIVAISFLAVFYQADIYAGYSTEESRFSYPNYSKRISMDFKDAALNDVLKIFSQQSGMNFIAASNLNDKRVTLFFDNIPVEEALEKILTANGLEYEMQPGSDIFVVKAIPGEGQNLVTRIYRLKYASVPSSKINSTISIGASTASDSSSSGSSSGASSGSSSGAASSGAGGGIVTALRGVVSKYGKVMEDSRTNSLIVTDMESQFQYIESLIARLDVDIPQIMIEVEMLDVSKGTADLIGVKYGEKILELTGAKRSVLYPWDLDLLKGKGYTFAEPEYVAGLLDTSISKVIVQFLETQSDTRNLARPRIVTLNNQTAQIQISTNEAIGISAKTTSTGGSSDTTREAERVQTGVFLLVTPQANTANGEITMAVSPKVIQARTGGTFGDQTFKDPEERGSQQILKVKTGETIVMGGLLRTDNTQIITKLPILGDIPLIGRAFRHKNKSTSERELLIFITPSIVNESAMNKNSPKDPNDLVREQKVPQTRLIQIDKELKSIERQKY